MNHLKLFESYFEDLTPYTYGRPKKGALNIGWLDSGKDFPKGDVDQELIDKLKQLEPSERTKGFHRCPFCSERHTGSTSFTIKGKDGVSYCFPQLITHYIEDHNYLPPQEFLDALLERDLPEDSGEAHPIFKGGTPWWM